MMIALGFVRLPIPDAAMPPAFAALHQWLDSWTGIGAIEHGMADVSLTRYADEGWRATFYNTGKEHSYTASTGSAWEAMVFRRRSLFAFQTPPRRGLADVPGELPAGALPPVTGVVRLIR